MTLEAVKTFVKGALTTLREKLQEWSDGRFALKTELPSDYLTDEDVASLFNDVAYDSAGKKIQFKHDTSVVKELDATPFIKDGMVNEVKIADGKTDGANSGKKVLLITFNTDSGKEDIEIPLTNIFDPTDYVKFSDVVTAEKNGLMPKEYFSGLKGLLDKYFVKGIQIVQTSSNAVTLDITSDSTNGENENDSTETQIQAATAENAGVMSAAMFTKLENTASKTDLDNYVQNSTLTEFSADDWKAIMGETA